MKKRILQSMLLCFLLTTFVTVSWITPAQANIHAGPTWTGPKYDKDEFHGITTTLIAFTTGTNATLRLTVRNDLSPVKPLNISAVKVLMDWSTQNISSTEASQSSPRVIPKYNSTFGLYYYYTFTIIVPVPATTIASNMFRHYYWVYVEEVNATTGPQRIKTHATATGSNFTVYSEDQATAQTTRIEYDRLLTTFSPVNNASRGLLKSASIEYNAGADSYKSGDFSGAKTHYGAALTLLKSARSTEETYQTTIQNNAIELTEAQIKQAEASAKQSEAYASYYNSYGNATLKQAEAAMIEANATMKMAEAQMATAQAINLQSTALNLFGFGFILFGVAAIIWAFKRPKPSL